MSRPVEKTRRLKFGKFLTAKKTAALTSWFGSLYSIVMQSYYWYLGSASEAILWEYGAVCQHTAQIPVIRSLTVNVQAIADIHLAVESLYEDCRTPDQSHLCS